MKERISIEKELENITSRPTKMNQPLEKYWEVIAPKEDSFTVLPQNMT
jgi:hypothetical protein